jgi:transcriptional regulator with XRE-family HTH domain
MTTKTTDRATPIVASADSLGEALRLMRAKADLRRDVIASRAGIASGTYSRYERDDTARPDVYAVRRVVVAFATELGADPEVLWTAFFRLIERTEASTRYVRAQVGAITPPSKRRRRGQDSTG